MAQKRCDLFKWKRKVDPLEFTRHGKKTSGVKDWIKRVQDASEQAVQEAFGGDIFGHEESLKEIIPDDEAVYEAQQLLDGWMSEKTFPHLDKELDFKSENWSSTAGIILNAESSLGTSDGGNCFGNGNTVFREDNTVFREDNTVFREDNTVLSELRNKYLFDNTNNNRDGINLSSEKYLQEDVYVDSGLDLFSKKSDLLSSQFLLKYGNGIGDVDDDIDDDLLVQDVLNGMLSKDIAKHIDLGMKPLSETSRNPVPEMNARHQQVKVRGEKRRKHNAVKKEETLSKEEIAQKARERIVQEEKQRIKIEKVEEAAILTEMEKIKLELAEERQRRKKDEERKQKILDDAKLQMQMELRKEREGEIRRKKEEEEERQQFQKEIEKQSIDELRQRMQILHKHFSAWYNLVLENRINIGKAQAIADWKCKALAWNAWRSYVTHVKSHEEAKAIEQEMKEKYRKNQMAVNHSKRSLLRLCFAAWNRYTHYQSEKKSLLYEHAEKSKKMALFLEAAAKGELWKKNEVEEMHREQICQDGSSTLTDTFVTDTCVTKPRTGDVNSNTILSETEASCSRHKHQENQCFKGKGNVKARELIDEKKKHRNVTCSNDNSNNPTKVVTVDVEQNDSGHLRAKDNLRSVNKIISSKENRNKNFNSKLFSAVQNKGIDNKALKQLQDCDQGGVENILLTDRSSISRISQHPVPISRRSQVSSEKAVTKPLHLAMEERQKQRDERKAVFEKEKRRKEEERLQELKAKEAERLQQEQDEKKEKLRSKQEQKKIEILKQKEKEVYIEQHNIKMNIAREHYHKVLLRKYGLEPLCRLVKIAEINIQISDKYHNSLILKLYFEEWKVYTKEVTTEKKNKADGCYKRIVMRRALRSWIKYRYHLQNMNKIARSYSSSRIRKRAFNAWQDYVTDERILMWAKESSAEDHDTVRMMKKCFKAWVRFVELEKQDRLCEQRRSELRRKVQSWLPDYKGETCNLSP